MHESEANINDYKSYQPIKDAVVKINKWIEQGAEVVYLTSRIKFMEVKDIKDVLRKFGFPGENVLARRESESYKEVVESVKPDILIEADCASIGSEEIITPKLPANSGVHGIVVPEFGGIEQLPESLDDLKYFGKKEEVAKE